MRYVLFSFTPNASTLCSELHKNLVNNSNDCTSYTTIKSQLPPNLTKLNLPLKEQIKVIFHNVDAIIFVSACAIAVRSIAPFLESKTTDPAVIVIDELGQYVISLLSGHIGGGNELTKQIADFIGATPIISTATDLNHLFAVDVFATKNNMYIDDMNLAKQVSSDLLNHKEIGLTSDFPVKSPLPDHLRMQSPDETSLPFGIAITLDDKKYPFEVTLRLIPKIITLGIGCKKGTPMEDIEFLILHTLAKHHISLHAIKQIASIDLKSSEEGLLSFCEKYHLPYITNTSAELASLEGDFTPSTFVKSVTGVDNVCERAALYQDPEGSLIIRKTVRNGVTIAVVLADYIIKFF
ncbi:cobalt-precorrin 5A hydrolase [Anaerosporobacter sp.]